MISSARISRLSRAVGRGEVDLLLKFFSGHGWGAAVREIRAGVGETRLLELSWGDEPQALVVLAEGEGDSQIASWGYSREAPYALAWQQERLALFDSRYWHDTPGDAPLIEANSSERWAVDELLAFLRPDQLLDDVPGAYGAPEKRQRELHETLARALNFLRLQVAQAGLLESAEPSARDAEVLRLFHQLLFIRFQEDRDHPASDVQLRNLSADVDIRLPLARVLEDYRRELNSELFAPVGIDVTALPAQPLVEVIRQLVEPWARLKLDFSVSRSEIAGRLYQSYLSSLPAEKPAEDQGTFFPDVQPTDRQAERGSYYTPPGLARLVVERTLVPWLQSKKPKDPSEVRVLDPACGSGAFLIAGYRALLDYFGNRRGRDLTGEERTEILLESIFGADVDERALELARVQLLEEADVRGKLPVLGKNLLHGDSLLSPPGTPSMPHAIDWDSALCGGRGFDAVLTNPPFLTGYKQNAKLSKDAVERLADLYPQVDSSYSDYAYLFVELGLRLLAADGVGGFVLPAGLVRAKAAAPVRSRLAEFGLRSIVDFDAGRLFDASTYVCTVSTGHVPRTELLRATDISRDGRVLLEAAERSSSSSLMRRQRVSRGLMVEAAGDGWDAFRFSWELDLVREVEADLAPLSSIGARVCYGTKPGRQQDFTSDADEWKRVSGTDKLAVGGHRVSEMYLPRLAKGKNLSPFYYSDLGQRLFVPYEADGSLSQTPDVVAELERRGGLATHPRHGDLSILRSPKLLLRTLAPEIAAYADLDGDLMPLMGEGGAIAMQFPGSDSETLLAYEALLNSAFYQWWLGGIAWPRQGGWFALNVSLVEMLPVPGLSRSDLSLLGAFANTLRQTLCIKNPVRRLREYHRTYAELDDLVMTLLGASTRLRAVVEREVKRVV
ncbi:MAG TPA: N-6 DNA methylase [Solirubrobacterales bacterium]